MNKDINDFPGYAVEQTGLQDILPVSVLEQYLNPYHVPSFESVSHRKGVIECLV
jgi:hypothetical protein